MQEFNAMDPRAEAALRGMIAHSDERFQALSTRVAAMEDTLVAMTNATRELRAAISRGAAIHVEGGGGDPEGVAKLQTQLNELERHLAAAFAHQAKQDAAREAALEQTVREGTDAMRGLVAEAAAEVGRLREAATSLPEVSLEGANINVDTSAMLDEFEERVVRLAALVRSDSTRIVDLLESKESGQEEKLSALLEARLGRVSELVSATTMSAVGEVARQVPDQAKAAMDEKIAELTTTLEESFVELANVSETEMHRMGRFLSERTAELVDAAIAGRLSATLERITQAADVIEAAGAGAGGMGLGEAATADMTALIDDRVTALAKMIRSDNQRMAQIVEVAAQQEAAKQTTRAVKELAANLPTQITEQIDRRFSELSENLHRETQSTIIAVAKAADVVSDRIGAVEDNYSSGVERAAERLGDAVASALANHRGAL